MVISSPIVSTTNYASPKHKIPTRNYNPFTFVLRERMVVLLNPVCVLLSEMLYVYRSDKSVAVLEIF